MLLRKNVDLERFLSLAKQIVNFEKERVPLAEKERTRLKTRENDLKTEQIELRKQIAKNDAEIMDRTREKANQLGGEMGNFEAELNKAEKQLKEKKKELEEKNTSKTENADTEQLNSTAIQELRGLEKQIEELKELHRKAKLVYDEHEQFRYMQKRTANSDAANRLQQISSEISDITVRQSELPDSPSSYNALALEASKALAKIGNTSLATSKLGDVLIEVMQKDTVILQKWIQSDMVLESIAQSSKFTKVYEDLLQLGNKSDDVVAALSRLGPFYAMSQKQTSDQSHEQEIVFQQSILDVQRALDEIEYYIKSKSPADGEIKEKGMIKKLFEAIANFRSENLTSDRTKTLHVSYKAVNNENQKFSEMVRNYHKANGRYTLLQAELEPRIKELTEKKEKIIPDMLEKEGMLDDDWFEEDSKTGREIVELSRQLETAKAAVERSKNNLKDFIQTRLPIVQDHYDTAKASKETEYKQMRTHHFFSSKRGRDTSAVGLLKNLVKVFQEVDNKINGSRKEEPNQGAKPDAHLQRMK